MSNHAKKLIIFLGLGVILVGAGIMFKTTNFGTQALWDISGQGTWLLPLIGVSAVVDSINPCAFSILLLTIAFLFSIGKLRTNILKIGSFYILGIFLVYLLIGLGITQTLHIFNTPHFMAKLGAALLIVLGLINVAGEFFPAFPVRLRIPHLAHRKMAELMDRSSLPAAVALGGLVGLCEFPCTGGPYLMVLGLLHDKLTYLSGVGYLLLYNLIFILPLVIILLVASNKGLLEKIQAWQAQEKPLMRLGGGIAMIILGILIFLI
ncbi:MAG: hypothetical protein A2941_01410 [Candidatus Yanofskybacteria bacterium RIFCSPLOWO2_01_FULL_49_17]|uniref:Uncharacterized protein n=1 Tax=Candidatus Yanofskybacteria bacterium RIFCSPLOWO2_01_FULL_49_17 TaxID=1802700 RepID=A0A1F8GQM2_9BACT|nr:MAG: hypothetical protein A2941_01410 [Candidatus Yanofskybacteria bacterium RIFCSPLOWO2_01_FULL_49_17]